MEAAAVIDSIQAMPPITQLVILTSLASGFGFNICSSPCGLQPYYSFTWTEPTEGPVPEFYMVDISYDDGLTWSWFTRVESPLLRIDVIHHGARVRAWGCINTEGHDVIIGEPSEPSDLLWRVWTE